MEPSRVDKVKLYPQISENVIYIYVRIILVFLGFSRPRQSRIMKEERREKDVLCMEGRSKLQTPLMGEIRVIVIMSDINNRTRDNKIPFSNVRYK